MCFIRGGKSPIRGIKLKDKNRGLDKRRVRSILLFRSIFNFRNKCGRNGDPKSQLKIRKEKLNELIALRLIESLFVLPTYRIVLSESITLHATEIIFEIKFFSKYKMLRRSTFQKLLSLMENVEAVASVVKECVPGAEEEEETNFNELVRTATAAYFKIEGMRLISLCITAF